MLRQTLKVLGITSLLVSPVTAQFGIGKKKKTSFQEKQEQAVAGDAGAAGELADMAKLQEMFAGAFSNPEAIAGFGEDMNRAMEELAKMDPADLQKQMQEAMAAMTNGDMVETIIEQKEAILANLEETGMVSEEELQKYKNDPAYFEEQMRGAFTQMQGMFSDPEILKIAGETMRGMQEALNDPAIAELTKLFQEGMADDTKIEEARLTLLSDPELASNPVFKAMFEGDEFQEILRDPIKWRESVKEGQQMFAGAAGGVGAGAAAGARVGHGEL
jgi:hypothetical protein